MEISETLTRKMGPLPTWAWIAIGASAGWYFLIYRKKAGNSGVMGPLGTGASGGPIAVDTGGGGGGGTGPQTPPTAIQPSPGGYPTPSITQSPAAITSALGAGGQWLGSALQQAQLAVQQGTATAEQQQLILNTTQQQANEAASGWYTNPLYFQQSYEQALGMLSNYPSGNLAESISPRHGWFGAQYGANPWAGTSGGLATSR